jgi:hypothetical protein
MQNSFVNLTTPLNYSNQAAQIDRRRRLADLLQKQADQPIDVQYGGGAPAPIPWTAVLAKGLQKGVASWQHGKVVEDQAALDSDARKRAAEVLANYARTPDTMGLVAQGGAPQKMELTAPAPMLNGTTGGAPDATASLDLPGIPRVAASAIPGRPTTSAERYVAALRMMASDNPILQNVGAPLWEGEVNQMTKAASPIKVAQNESLIDPVSFKPLFKAVAPPKAPTTRTINIGDREVTQEFVDGKWQQVGDAPRYKPTGTTVNISPEKSYAGAMTAKLADMDAATLDVARSAPQRIQSAQNVLRILDNQQPITGTGANARLMLDKALVTAGIVDGKNVTSTENLASELASQTLSAIKTSGLGTGNGFTDKDRQFLEKAASGSIEINAGTLHYLARKNEEAARASLQRGNAVARRLKGNPTFGSVGQDLEIPEPPPYSNAQGVGADGWGTPRLKGQ